MAADTEPFACQPAKSNTYDKLVFDLVLIFGASVLTIFWGKDFISAVRNSAGNYTVVLPRRYRRFVGMKHGWIKCAAGQVLQPVILTDNSNVSSATGGGSLVLEIRTAAGTATDPANGDKLSLELAFSNNVLNDKTGT